uniref:uncharacterized protein LOC120340410 n=1 Tax=Styela clava TaxID=7725 RepID=UPI00193A5C2B|nr:uncharacterized protein LOC120340410 [Styela clava]
MASNSSSADWQVFDDAKSTTSNNSRCSKMSSVSQRSERARLTQLKLKEMENEAQLQRRKVEMDQRKVEMEQAKLEIDINLSRAKASMIDEELESLASASRAPSCVGSISSLRQDVTQVLNVPPAMPNNASGEPVNACLDEVEPASISHEHQTKQTPPFQSHFSPPIASQTYMNKDYLPSIQQANHPYIGQVPQSEQHATSILQPQPIRQESKHVPDRQVFMQGNPTSYSHGPTPVLVGDNQNSMSLADALYCMASSIRQGPQEIEKFDGDALSYHRFIQNFDDMYDSKIADPRTKLNYLIDQCTGKARKAIESCIIVKPPLQGYLDARSILKQQFGRDYKVVNAFMDSLKNGPSIKPQDSEALYDLATQMRNCGIILTNWEHSSKLDSQELFDKIYLRPPVPMQREFTRHHTSTYNSDKEPTYHDLYKFVNQSAILADTRLSRLTAEQNLKNRNAMPKKSYNSTKVSEHVARNCPSDNRCKIENCGKLHHSLLHNQERIRQDKPSDRNSASDTSTHVVNGSTDASILNSRKRVYLMIVLVNVTSSDGSHSVKTTALLDYGSNATLCKLSLMKKLKVKGKQDSFTISTVNGLHKQNGYRLDLNVKGLQESDKFMLEDVLAVESLPILSDGLPTKADIQSYRHLNGIDFPEIGNHEPELLIGADNYEALIIQDRRLGNKGQPAAVHTPLGWTLIGKNVSRVTNGMSINFANVEKDILCEQLQKMFNCDFSESDFTESYKFAKKRLDYLKRKFQRDPEYLEKYKEKIHEYIDNDYAKKIPEDHVPSDEKKIWYLPHHSTGEKFRLVFDCSFKVDNVSLNNQVLQGPDHCSNLVGVLTRFRQEDIAFVCDIKGMFHQVEVHPDDWDSLRFLWYPNDDLSKEFYFMTRSLFGLTSSPSAAGYALKRAAIDNETNANIDVLNTVNNNFYVDDCLKSCDSPNCAIDTINQLDCLLSNI